MIDWANNLKIVFLVTFAALSAGMMVSNLESGITGMVSVDDESFPLTMDVRSDRVNLSIKDSIVIDTYIG